MVVTGWRAAVLVLLGLAVLLVLFALVLWVAVALGVLGAVLWLNLIVVPRLSTRLRVPRLALELACLPLLAAPGWLLGGLVGAGFGGLAWLAGIALPRLAGRRLRARVRGAAWGPSKVVAVESPALPASGPGRQPAAHDD